MLGDRWLLDVDLATEVARRRRFDRQVDGGEIFCMDGQTSSIEWLKIRINDVQFLIPDQVKCGLNLGSRGDLPSFGIFAPLYRLR